MLGGRKKTSFDRVSIAACTQATIATSATQSNGCRPNTGHMVNERRCAKNAMQPAIAATTAVACSGAHRPHGAPAAHGSSHRHERWVAAMGCPEPSVVAEFPSVVPEFPAVAGRLSVVAAYSDDEGDMCP